MLSYNHPISARYAALGIALSASLLGLLSAHAIPDVSRRTGEQIFKQQCAKCHGAKGEGTTSYKKSLTGTRSVPELATFIAKSMPPGAPKKLPAEEAKGVATYIYDTFYSAIAQARNRPARIELSHLTARQYRNAVCDLIGSFRPAGRPDQRRGLRGEYYKVGRFRDRALERVDPQIRFDFGTSGAIPEQTDPYQFSMRWEGSVIAPDTGEYDFIVRTEHAVRLWINDQKQPVIDALVKSGSDNEYHAAVFLLGGRAYPLRLEFSKGVQGVDDLSKLKQKPAAKASLTLEWRPPKRAPEVIPERNLCPMFLPEAYVVTAPFPPEDRSTGYERASSISKAWDEATTGAALETAAYITSRLREFTGVQDGAAERPAKLQEFCRRFASRAFRRPLSPEQDQRFIAEQFKKAPDPETAAKRVILLALKSPRFLYRDIGPSADAYDVASRLAFALWDSLPDDDLLKAAAAGELTTRDQAVRQAERMVSDHRSWSKLREFLLQWLKVDQYPDLAKDPKKYPGFDQAAAADLRTSLELFLEQTVWNDKSDFRELFTTDKVMMDGRLAKLYGVELPADAPYQSVSLDPTERAGVLTHPYMLSGFAYTDSSSPIHRGVLIARSLLGRALRPPPQAFAPTPASVHPNMTTRQRVALQTQSAPCMSCHSMINPLGFTLEKFDAIGRLRAQENGQPVDSSGSYQSRDGKTIQFKGVRDLAHFLAESDEAHGAFVEKLFQYMVKQPVQAYGASTLPDLERAFAANQFSIRRQMVETAVLSALKAESQKRIPTG